MISGTVPGISVDGNEAQPRVEVCNMLHQVNQEDRSSPDTTSADLWQKISNQEILDGSFEKDGGEDVKETDDIQEVDLKKNIKNTSKPELPCSKGYLSANGITIELMGQGLWKKFYKLGTEMIITKAGR